MQYTDSNITFSSVKPLSTVVSYPPIGYCENYKTDPNTGAIIVRPIINAIDIDWNNADMGDAYINTTGQLLYYIKNRFGNITISRNYNSGLSIATINNNTIYIPNFQSLIDAILARIAELEARVRALENGSNVLKITITFNGNGGTIYGLSSWQRTISQGEEIGTLPVAERSGYRFNCWKTLNGEIIYNSTVLNEDTTLYAQWEEVTPVVTTYTVTYHSNGGNSTPASRTVNAGETVTLAGAISRNADSSYTYEFSHWNTNSSNKGISYSAGQTIPVNNNIDLYAQWNKTPITPVTPTTEYYWYVGQTQPTANNYTSLATQVNEYTSPIEYTNTSGTRGRSYILIHNGKSVASVIGKVSGGNVSFSEDTSVDIPNYKVYKTAAIAIDSTIIITIQ